MEWALATGRPVIEEVERRPDVRAAEAQLHAATASVGVAIGNMLPQLNITGIISEQNHEQHYGIEHMAVTTDDYTGTLARLRENGVTVLEELKGSSGNRVAFVAATDGSQMEIIEKS